MSEVNTEKKALAKAAKEKGNALFQQGRQETFTQAIAAYTEAIGHDPSDHIFYANRAACHLELGKITWEPRKKLEAYAQALTDARRCTELGPEWAKGYARLATAEFELLAAKKTWEEERRRSEEAARLQSAAAKEAGGATTGGAKEEEELGAELSELLLGASYQNCENACRTGLELGAESEPLRLRLQALRDSGHATDEARDRELRDPKGAAELKTLGNKAFGEKKFSDAAEQYTKALALDPFDHVFYSNRSACYSEMQGAKDPERALRDAERCVTLNPEFAKGFSRKSLALFNLGRYPEAEAAAAAGLGVDPASAALKEMLEMAQAETKEPPEVQAMMHRLRQQQKTEARMYELMRGLNAAGGGNVQMLNPEILKGLQGEELQDVLSGKKAPPGSGARGNPFGAPPPSMNAEQMREVARKMVAERKATGRDDTATSKL